MFTCMETESFDAVTERRTRKRAGRCGGSSPQVRDRRPPISARDSNAQGQGGGLLIFKFSFPRNHRRWTRSRPARPRASWGWLGPPRPGTCLRRGGVRRHTRRGPPLEFAGAASPPWRGRQVLAGVPHLCVGGRGKGRRGAGLRAGPAAPWPQRSARFRGRRKPLQAGAFVLHCPMQTAEPVQRSCPRGRSRRGWTRLPGCRQGPLSARARPFANARRDRAGGGRLRRRLDPGRSGADADATAGPQVRQGRGPGNGVGCGWKRGARRPEASRPHRGPVPAFTPVWGEREVAR